VSYFWSRGNLYSEYWELESYCHFGCDAVLCRVYESAFKKKLLYPLSRLLRKLIDVPLLKVGGIAETSVHIYQITR
jgi:hypothetical protein